MRCTRGVHKSVAESGWCSNARSSLVASINHPCETHPGWRKPSSLRLGVTRRVNGAEAMACVVIGTRPLPPPTPRVDTWFCWLVQATEIWSKLNSLNRGNVRWSDNMNLIRAIDYGKWVAWGSERDLWLSLLVYVLYFRCFTYVSHIPCHISA